MGVVRSGKQKAESRKQKAERRKQKAESNKQTGNTALSFMLYALCFLLCAFHPAVGQVLTFSEPEKLPATINTAAEEGMPLLSPDGKTLYFARSMYEGNVGGKYAGQDVWASKWDGKKWGKAVNTIDGFRNNKNNNSIVGISSDGKTIYFLDASPHQKIKGIYFSRNINGKWTPAELIPIEGLSNDGFLGFNVSPDFQVILISMKGEDSRGEEDLYVSLKDANGKWGKPRNLGPSINTPGFEISPFLTADKKRLFFSSNGHPGFGDGDIFYAERLYDSWETWSAPRNLGEGVNTKNFEGGFVLFGDTLSYFTSNRANTYADIYLTSASLSFNPIRKELSKDEIKEIFGANFSPLVKFSDGGSNLTSSHKELLWYIGSKLVGKYEIQILLEIPPQQEDAVMKNRVSAVITQLALSGLEGSRIIQPDYAKPDRSLSSDELRLIFVR